MVWRLTNAAAKQFCLEDRLEHRESVNSIRFFNRLPRGSGNELTFANRDLYLLRPFLVQKLRCENLLYP